LEILCSGRPRIISRLIVSLLMNTKEYKLCNNFITSIKPQRLKNKISAFIISNSTPFEKIETRAGLLAVRQVLNNLEREISLKSDLAESGRILFSFLVKISHKDFELWWKHCRKTENKVHYVSLIKKNTSFYFFLENNKFTVSEYKLLIET
jgi:hypothetical protein